MKSIVTELEPVMDGAGMNEFSRCGPLDLDSVCSSCLFTGMAIAEKPTLANGLRVQPMAGAAIRRINK